MNKVPVEFFNHTVPWRHYKEYIGDADFHINTDRDITKIKIFVNSSLDNESQEDKKIFTIFLQTEPRTLQTWKISYVEKNNMAFDLILAHDEKLLDLPNCKFFRSQRKYYWVRPAINSNIKNMFHHNIPANAVSPNFKEECDYSKKKFLITMICGHKQTGPGNKLRIACWSRQNEIQIPSRFYKSHTMKDTPVFPDNINTQYANDKTEMFVDAMFHVAIENSAHKNYFTEKIHDCFMTHTIPIYWGCPNISDYYNPDGIIVFEDENDFIEKVNSLTPELYYSKIDAVNENYEKFVKAPEFIDEVTEIISNY